jgi:hypothetical protein
MRSITTILVLLLASVVIAQPPPTDQVARDELAAVTAEDHRQPNRIDASAHAWDEAMPTFDATF